jgi:RHS repeat-associated protein
MQRAPRRRGPRPCPRLVSRTHPGARARCAAACAALLWLAACGGDADSPEWGALLAASPGLPRWQQAAIVPVPGGAVNAAGGNLLVRRTDLALDTRLGTWEIGAVYNSKSRGWLWSFDASYDGRFFVDASGAHHDLGYVAEGALVPGTVWIELDASRIRSVGGLVHEFAADGHLAAVRWASDAYPRLEHVARTIAGEPRITEIRQCSAPGACAGAVAIAYDEAGRVISLADRAGRRAEFGYDAEGRLAVARDALDVERALPGFRYEYRGEGLLHAITSSEGERVEYAWHPNQARLVEARAIGAEHPVHRFEYAFGLDAPAPYSTRHVDPLGHATLYRYDEQRRVHRVTAPDGAETRSEWTGYELSKRVLPGGATTTWEHVDDDEVIRTDPNGNVVRFDFLTRSAENREAPDRRPLERIDDSLGPVERRGYDAKGRLVWIENGAGERTRFAWNAENLLASATRPDGLAAEYADYGEHGHARRVAFGGEVAAVDYDEVGDLVSLSGLALLDPRTPGEVARRHDGDRNLAELVLADPATGPGATASVRLAWRSDRRPLRIERPGGHDHSFDYDALGRLVARHERAQGSWRAARLEVDPLGRTTAEELPNGMRRELAYDEAGRPALWTARRDGVVEGTLAIGWQHAHPVAFDDSLAGGVETQAFDAAGQLAAIDYPHGERLELARDLRGRVVRETYRLADGSVLREIGFAWDAAGRPLLATEDGAPLLLHAWSAGRLARTTYGSGVARERAYDPTTGLLAAVRAAPPGGAPIEQTDVSLARDEAAGLLRLAVQTASAGPAAALTREELALAPLAAAGQRLAAWGDGAATLAYAADALGNTLTAGGEALRYDAEGARLLAIERAASGEPLVDYAWDDAGYCTARGGLPLAWTALGRIAAIGGVASFAWDLRGRPLARTHAGVAVRFLFGGRVEADAAGVARRLDLGEAVLHLDTGGRRYRHLDFRGNAKLESDDAGRVTLHRRFGPYGVDAALGEGDGTAAFAGGLDLGELVLVGERVLDPRAGRFLSPDPVLQVVNQYAYALANPVAFWDPDGREIQPSGFYWGIAVALGTSVVASGFASPIAAVAIGTPLGVVLGLAVAQLIYQQIHLGERGPFTLRQALESAVPLYVSPPGAAEPGARPGHAARGEGGRAGGGGGGGGAPPGCDCNPSPTSPPILSAGSVRFSAFGASGVGGAIGGGFGGF